ncbi:MAG: GntR family transcriptional regulator [Rhodospirillales bacterium]|jgi:DNA-binding GntR family transcriptional regulator
MLTMKIDFIAAPIRQQVVKALRNAIIAGDLKPGQRLVEKDLCSLLGASRPPVREALRELESEGLIRIVPNRGAEVATLDAKGAESIYQVRAVLEALAAQLFAERADAAQIASLRLALDKVRRAYRKSDTDKHLDAKAAFYAILVHGSGNEAIGPVLQAMNARINVMRRLSLSSPKRLPESLKELTAIVEAIERRDADGAFRASLQHVHHAAEVALKALPGAGN